MKIEFDYTGESLNKSELIVYGAFQKGSDDNAAPIINWKDKDNAQIFKSLKTFKNFSGSNGEMKSFTGTNGESVLCVGLGQKSKLKEEELRKTFAKVYKSISGNKYKTVSVDIDSFNSLKGQHNTATLIQESIELTSYSYDKYFSKKNKNLTNKISLYISDKKLKRSIEKSSASVSNITSSVNFTRDLVNEAPNVLHSVEYAKRIEKDVKENLKGVKVKVLGKSDLKKEKMNLFLAVNAGSAHEPRLVHLTYTPKKVTKNTKHYALVGKGLTFDTGGYSLKPGNAMMGMKFDMGGSATVYGAFRAAVLNNSPYKITCILGMTDNAVNSHATFPDSIVKGRNGKTVEILNTDAEGRLVLADCLDYACDQKPNYIIDAATLTGACLVALGSQVCAVLGNDKTLVNNVLKTADNRKEYAWQLPIIDEWRTDMHSKIADLKNIGTPARAGTATAAAFLENFIKDDIKWAHLDIAGVCDSQAHLPYCPSKGASGLMVRTLHDLLTK